MQCKRNLEMLLSKCQSVNMSSYPYDINEQCLIVRLTSELATLSFECGNTEGDKDLEDFFHNQAIHFLKKD